MALALCVVALCSGPIPAHAHGRPAALQTISVQPGQPAYRIAQATWGLAVSEDSGASWRWLCAAAMGVDARMEDPSVVVMGDGSILAGTFDGLLRSEDGGCSWTRPATAIEDVYVVDLERVGADTAYLLAASTGLEDRLFRSRDHGATWTETAAALGAYLVDKVRAAPSQPERVYAGARIAATPDAPRRAFLLRSDDAGETFVAVSVALGPTETGLLLWAVDPADPDVLYGSVTHLDGETAPQRVVRSQDGGATFETVLEVPYVGGVLFLADASVLVGSRLGGLHRAEDGRTFEVVDADLPVTCLSVSLGEVTACIDQARAGFALATSLDGQVFTPSIGLSDIDELVACPSCSPAGVVCPAWEPDVIYDLGLDASLPPGFSADGGTGAPRDAGLPDECRPDAGPGALPPAGCGCAVQPNRSAPPWLVLVTILCRFRIRRSR